MALHKNDDLVGQKFTRLFVEKLLSYDTYKRTMYQCLCDCGNRAIISANALVSGNTKSCGCLRKEKGRNSDIHKIHGDACPDNTTRLYKIWRTMKTRCLNPSFAKYKDYGGRGIKICDDWVDNYSAFKEWAINNGYADNLSIDRIDNNGNYEPNNCKWSTGKEQCRNRRTNHLITYNGKTQCLTDWAEELGINRMVLFARINNRHWTIERAFTTPVVSRN